MSTYSKSLMMGAAAVALLAGSAWAQDNARVGITSAVNPAAVGTPPGASPRPMVIGGDVIFRERVVTTADGQAQLLFLDQSSLMIGPNSQIVIDEFIYDPSTSTGKFAATLTQGSFRYIGGKLSKQGDATLRTPVATIGIRGSDVTVTHDSASNTSGIQNAFGNATVEGNGQSVKVPTGFATQVNGTGGPSRPVLLTAEMIATAKAMFEGKQGQSAGAPRVPTDADVGNSNLPGTVQAAILAAIQTAAGGNVLTTVRPLVQIPPPDPYTAPLENAPPTTFAPGTPDPTTPPGGTPGGTPVPVGSMPPPDSGALVHNGYVAGQNTTASGSGSGSFTVRNTNAESVIVHLTPPSDSDPGKVVARLGYSGVGTPSPQNFTVDLGDFPGSPATGESTVFEANSFAAFSRNNSRTVETPGGTLPISANVNGIESGSIMAMVTLDNSLIGSLPGVVENIESVSVCACEFMTWGVWGGVKLGPGAAGTARIDSVLGTFVTGILPSVAIAPTGTATFTGHAIGVSSSSPGTWTAGNANVGWNFGTRSGNMQITNFDGNNMQGAITAPSDWRHYSGTLAPMAGSTGPATAGAANGSFFVAPGAAPGTQPAGTGGNFTMTGPGGYNASGVFVGQNTSGGSPGGVVGTMARTR